MGPPISERIDHLQRKKQDIAVVHADGHPRSLVTSTNAFDAIAGELEEPGDVGRRDRSRQDPEPVGPSSPGARPQRFTFVASCRSFRGGPQNGGITDHR